MEHAIEIYNDLKSNEVYKVVGAVILAIVIYRIAFKQREYKHFPPWAVIEIAVTTSLLSGHGLGRDIM